MAAKKSRKPVSSRARPAKKSATVASRTKGKAAPAKRPTAAKRSSSAVRVKPSKKVATSKKVTPAKRRSLTARRPSPRRPARKAAPVAKPAFPENPEALALARRIAGVALEKKATDVLLIDTRARGASVGYDYIVLASGDSERQLEAIAAAVNENLKSRGIRAASIEASADWVLANYDDVVAHFFTPETRGLYDLEGLWSDAPRVDVDPE